MKTGIFLLLCFALGTLTGCPTKNRPSTKMAKPDLLAAEINSYLATSQKKYDCHVQGFAYTASGSTVTCVGGVPNVAVFHPLAQQLRDEMIEDSLGTIDSLYGDFVSDLSAGRATTNLIADIIDLGMGAAIGITNGERALQVLGVSLTAFRGGRNSVDLNYFKEFATPILITKMNDNRARQYAVILVNKKKPISQYGIKSALRDTVAYFNAGTLVEAFNELSVSTAVQLQESQKTVLTLKNADPAAIVRLPLEASESGAMISRYRFNYQRIFNSGTPVQKTDAQAKLRLVYVDLRADPDFAPVLAKVRTDNPALVAEMDNLANPAAVVHSGVAGIQVITILREVFQALDLNKDAKMVVALRKYYDKHF